MLNSEASHPVDTVLDLLDRQISQMHEMRIVHRELVDHRNKRGHGAAHGDKPLRAVGKSRPIGLELRARPCRGLIQLVGTRRNT